jgi:hypothetical protein
MKVRMAVGRLKALWVLSPEQHEQLESMASSRALPAGLVNRVRIVLMSAAGKTNQRLARQVELANATLGKWQLHRACWLARPYQATSDMGVSRGLASDRALS